MYLATAILTIALIAAAILLLKSYRPTPATVVERARVPQDVRAKVNTDARLRLRLHQQRRAGRSHPPLTPPDVAPAVAPPRAFTTATVCLPAPVAPPRALVQGSLAHHRDGAARPGSYFRVVESPSQETIMSAVRGPWASQIVNRDGRITLPDSDADVALAWVGSE